MNEKAVLKDLCEQIGYGRVMQLAEELWREKSKALGQPGGEHTTGPCAMFMVPCPSKAHPTSCGDHCMWCCGNRRVTKKVAAVIRAVEGDGE